MTSKKHKCFYCRTELGERHVPFGQRQPRDAMTTDHIVPKSKINPALHPVSVEWHALNTVFVCFRCNAQKADMWPLDWIEIMPALGIEALSLRLIRLGCPAAEIDVAISRRTA